MRFMTRLPSILTTAVLLICASADSAAVVGVNGGDSGRIGADSLNGVNYTFGTANAETAAGGNLFDDNSSLIGDNPNNTKFAQMWRFDVTSAVATDIANGYQVRLKFTSGPVNNGGGAPTDIDVYLLAAGNGVTRGAAAGATPLASLGSISGTAPNTPYDLQVTGLPTINSGDRIWIGLISGVSTNNSANNIFIAGPNSNSINATLETVIPEPASLALAGLGGLLILGRGRRGHA